MAKRKSTIAREAAIDKLVEDVLKNSRHVTHTFSSTRSTDRDRPFNAYRTAKSDAARTLVKEVIDLFLDYERRHSLRSRHRHPDNQALLRRQIEAIACDLAHRTVTSPGNWVAVTFSKQVLGHKQRYRAPVFTGTFPDLVRALATPELVCVEYVVGYKSVYYEPYRDRELDRGLNFQMPDEDRQTVLRAGEFLKNRIAELDLSVQDFGLDKSEEIIILKSAKYTYFDKAKPLRYEDTPTTDAMREQVWRINDWLDKAEIAFEGLAEDPIDLTDRRLRRIFNNGNFDEGGRLYGGFWQQMPKIARKGILLGGQKTITLDYGQIVPRILYGLAGCTPHFNDAYTVPGLEQHRQGVKILFNAMLHVDKPLVRFPKGSKDLFPDGSNAANVTQQVIAFHAPIANAFQSGRGMYYSKLESEILIAVLENLISLSIPALPIHDAVVIGCDDEVTVMAIMEAEFKRLTGIEAIVSRDD